MKTKNAIKRVLAIVLVFATLFSTTAFVTASAASRSYPSLSTSSYCEFTANKTIYVYRNSSLTTRGTASPAKSYNAYICSGDVCKIYKITSSYVQLAYPTSSGYKTAYARRSDIIASSSAVDYVSSSASKVTTYKSASTSSSYGYVSAGDRVYKAGTSGSFTQIMYPAKSGSRAYKLAYVTTAKYNNGIKSTPVSSSTLRFPMKGSITRSSSVKTNGYYCDYRASSGTKVYAPANGTAKFYQAYGYVNGTNKLVSYGNYIEFTSSDGVYRVKMCHLNGFNGVSLSIPSSRTAQLSASRVSTKTKLLATKSVSQGDLLGYTGATGNASGPHLHIEVYKNGSAKNPASVFSTWN